MVNYMVNPIKINKASVESDFSMPLQCPLTFLAEGNERTLVIRCNTFWSSKENHHVSWRLRGQSFLSRNNVKWPEAKQSSTPLSSASAPGITTTMFEFRITAKLGTKKDAVRMFCSCFAGQFSIPSWFGSFWLCKLVVIVNKPTLTCVYIYTYM